METDNPRSLKRFLLGRKAVLLCSVLIAALCSMEILVRTISVTDSDGNVTLRRTRLRPYKPQVNRTREVLKKTGADNTLAYDPDLGWSPKPGARSREGLYQYDERGARTGGAPHDQTVSGATKVALFGDSFMHGDEVPWSDSLAPALESRLSEAGKPVEISNFAVPGYGMDQALMRYRKVAKSCQFDLVVFGFQAENAGRNLNLVRVIRWWKSGLPFTKPRFIIENGQLEIVNRPAVAPEALPHILADFRSWPLARYEHYYDPQDYSDSPWRKSRLVSLVSGKASRLLRGDDRPTPEGEEWQICVRIVQSFHEEVVRDGTRLVVVHLPTLKDLQYFASEKRFKHGELLSAATNGIQLIDAAALMVRMDLAPSNFFVRGDGGGHYSRAGNGILADILVEELPIP